MHDLLGFHKLDRSLRLHGWSLKVKFATFLFLILAHGLSAQVGAISQSVSGMALYINILEGEDALNNIHERTAREPIVQVTDENHQPVKGAAVSFTTVAGATGAGGAFGALVTYTAVTDADGKAVAHGFQPNQIVGKYKIEVIATIGMLMAVLFIHETNVDGGYVAEGNPAAVGTGGSFPMLPPFLLGASASMGLGVGLVQAFVGNDSVPAPSSTLSGTTSTPATVPEIDPSWAFGCVIFLAGSLAVLRGR